MIYRFMRFAMISFDITFSARRLLSRLPLRHKEYFDDIDGRPHFVALFRQVRRAADAYTRMAYDKQDAWLIFNRLFRGSASCPPAMFIILRFAPHYIAHRWRAFTLC